MHDPRVDRSGDRPGVPGSPRLGEAYRTAWRLFMENFGAFVLGVLTWVVALIAVAAACFPLLRLAADGDVTIGPDGAIHDTGGTVGFAIASVIYPMVLFFVATFALSGLAHAALVALDGGRVEFRDFFAVPNARSVLAWAGLNAVACGVLTMTIIGPLIWCYFAIFVAFFILAKNMRMIDAFRIGFSLAARSAGTTLVLFLVLLVAVIVGVVLFGVALAITVPPAMLASAYAFRRLTG